MNALHESTLEVPGATLFYKVRGSGPLLLILQGGAGDADGSAALAEQLSDAYTVLTYDRRGLSRSALQDTSAPISIEVHSEDAHRLLAALTPHPAYVFGASIGALIALDLVARHPEQVRALVAHEPGIAELLTECDRAAVTQKHAEVDQIYRRIGLPAAMKEMAELSGLNLVDREPDVKLPAPDGQSAVLHMRNLNFFLSHDAPAAHNYKLDVPALEAAATKIIPAAGRTSAGSVPHKSVLALANRLGSGVRYFPGGHTAYFLRPREFASTLRQALSAY